MTPATDIERTCQRCGTLTYCCIVRTFNEQTCVEKAEAVCPACAEGERG